MSIIGTRPPLLSETSLYELHHRARLAIKPGITGMWQVSGRSDITDFEEVVRLDKEYMGNDKRYMIYSKLKSSDLSSDIELREAMGEFMVQWIHLEELVSKLTVNQNIRTRSPFSVNNLKRIFPDSELKKVLGLRRYRNLMVHGVEFPPVDQIKYMTNEVERVCKYLENKKKM